MGGINKPNQFFDLVVKTARFLSFVGFLFFSFIGQVNASSTYNFDSDTIGSAPTSWTSTVGTWQTQSDKAYSSTNSLEITASQNRGFALEENTYYDTTISSKVYFTAATDKSGLVLRYNNISGTHYYYRFYLNVTNLNLERAEGVSQSLIKTVVYTLPTNNAWYNMKFQVSGSVFRGKIWIDGSVEPEVWNIEGEDSSFASGQSGLFAHNAVSWFDDVVIDGSPNNINTVSGITYTSTLDSLALKMDVAYNRTTTNQPIMLVLQGYRTTTPDGVIERYADKGLFAIRVYKRSYGGSAGTSDDSAREIYDLVDAIDYVKTNYASYIDTTNINVAGYSGGCGNTYGLITKFPDYFRTAQCFFGMSDYGYNDTYGWYNNGAYGTYLDNLVSRIGGTPTNARDNYYARAFYLGAKNNPYTHIQLFYDTDETVAPTSHAHQYYNQAQTAGLTNVIERISDSASTTSEISDIFSSSLSDWKYLASGDLNYSWNNSGSLAYTTARGASFNVVYKKFKSQKVLAKTDHFYADFSFNLSSMIDRGIVLYGFRNSSDIAVKNIISTRINFYLGVKTLYIETFYNETPLDAGNVTSQAFTTPITTETDYNFHLEMNNGVVTGILKDSLGVVIETQTLTMDEAKSFDGVDSFGVFNYNDQFFPVAYTIGTLDNLEVTTYSRWIHGYPVETDPGKYTIIAENYFVPDILAETYVQPSLNTSGSMFIPGYIKTNQFYITLGNGNNEAGNLTYNISGNAVTLSTTKSFTVEGLTDTADINLKVYNLSANTAYWVKDSNLTDGGSTTTSVTTSSGGTLTFDGILGSTHKYEVYQLFPSNLSASANLTTITLAVDSFPNDTSGSSGYYFSRLGANSGWIQTNSWQDTGLSCGTSYTYSVKYRNSAGIETDSISTTQTTYSCGNGPIFSGSASSMPGYTPPRQQTIYPDGRIVYLEDVITPTPTSTNTTVPTSPVSQVMIDTFTKDFKYGMTDGGIEILQKFLNTNGFFVSSKGPGSPGSETRYFGLLTKSALIKFQNYYKDYILTPLGLTNGTGYFGASTRKYIEDNF